MIIHLYLDVCNRFQICFHIPNGVPFGCLLKQKGGSPFRGFLVRVPSVFGWVFFSEEGPAFRCPESVALATDFEREGAAVFWVEAGGARRGWWLVWRVTLG